MREWRPLAEQGDAQAQAALGGLYEAGHGVPQDYAEAAKWYREAAEQGLAQAQTSFGYMYDMGLGMSRNYAEAAKWYRKAAEQGLAQAQFNLGLMYGQGKVALDHPEALKWYRKAAEQGLASAQFEVGAMYYMGGLGVSPDLVLAHMWLNLAINHGYKKMGGLRDMVADRMTPEQVAEVQKLAREWEPGKGTDDGD